MYLEHCTSDQLKAIYGDLRATEESIKNDVQYLMEWMEKQPHLPKIKGKSTLCWKILNYRDFRHLKSVFDIFLSLNDEFMFTKVKLI